MKVRATMLGFYGGSRRRPGDVFILTDVKHFSEKWMQRLEVVTDDKPLPVEKSKGKHRHEAKAKPSGDADVI